MRVKRGVKARRRRNKVLDRAEGYYSSGSRLFSFAKEKNDRALVYAFRDRKVKKRHFRQLWITRIAAAAKLNGTSYSKLMGALVKSKLELNRKVLADLAVSDPQGFTEVVKKVLPQK